MDLRRPQTIHAQIRVLWIQIFVAFGIHAAMAMSLGAKFWFDTIAYFQLASVIFDPAALRSLYEGQFGIVYLHIMPGLPVLIASFERMFGALMWPAFAILQYGLSAFSVVYLANSLGTRVSGFGKMAIIVLASLFPYYSAFHAAILTESLSASIFIVILGLTMRSLDHRMTLGKALALILILGVIGGQFRSYITGIGGLCAVSLIFDAVRFRKLYLYGLTVATVALGVLIFPVYRASVGIEFASPNVDALMLRHASYVTWDLDDPSQRALNGVVLEPDIRDRLIRSTASLSLDDVVKIVDDLVATGKSRAEARKLIRDAAWTVRTQTPEAVSLQLQLSLSSIGLQELATCCIADRRMSREGMTAADMMKHLQHYYYWNAGLSDNDYISVFDSFTEAYRKSPGLYAPAVIDWYVDRVAPFVRAQPATARYLLLPMLEIPADILVVVGLAGLFLLGWRDGRLGLLLLAVLGLVYATSTWASFVGDNRHAHLFWPLYFIGMVTVVEQLIISLVRAKPE